MPTSKEHCRPRGHPAHRFQLTAFNDAKLWSLYLVIGNELRYKNAIYHQAFEHIAYFVLRHVYAIAFKFVPTIMRRLYYCRTSINLDL
jgi:hypothetical protein